MEIEQAVTGPDRAHGLDGPGFVRQASRCRRTRRRLMGSGILAIAVPQGEPDAARVDGEACRGKHLRNGASIALEEQQRLRPVDGEQGGRRPGVVQPEGHFHPAQIGRVQLDSQTLAITGFRRDQPCRYRSPLMDGQPERHRARFA